MDINIVIAWFIYDWLSNVCAVAFFSLWEIGFGTVRACVSVYCLHVHVPCVRVCVCVCVCVSPRQLLCMHCMSVSSTWERGVTSPGGLLLSCVCVRVCISVYGRDACLSVCTTPGIAMVYYCALMHGSYGTVCVSNEPKCVRVCVRLSTVQVFDVQLWREMLHNSLNVPFQSLTSGVLWLRSMDSFGFRKARLSFSLYWGLMISFFPPSAGL